MENEKKDDLNILNQEGENLENHKDNSEEITISKKEYQSLLAQKEHWREKAKAVEKESEKPKTPELKLEPHGEEPLKSFDPIETIKLINTLRDYSPEEIELISKQARAYGVDLSDAVKIEDVQLLIEAKRDKIKNDKANPIPVNRQEEINTEFHKWTLEDKIKLTSNPTKENLAKLGAYNTWLRKQK